MTLLEVALLSVCGAGTIYMGVRILMQEALKHPPKAKPKSKPPVYLTCQFGHRHRILRVTNAGVVLYNQHFGHDNLEWWRVESRLGLTRNNVMAQLEVSDAVLSELGLDLTGWWEATNGS